MDLRHRCKNCTLSTGAIVWFLSDGFSIEQNGVYYLHDSNGGRFYWLHPFRHIPTPEAHKIIEGWALARAMREIINEPQQVYKKTQASLRH